MANPAYFPGPDTPEVAEAVAEVFEHGELAPFPASSETEPDLSEHEKAALQKLWQEALDRNATARRWEVLQCWEARLFARGYQRLLPLMGGGWIVPPFGAAYVRPTATHARRGGTRLETNIYTTYSEIITAALTRDVPIGRFFPYNPDKDADVTAADCANRYAKIFRKTNDLLTLTEQEAYYLCHDGRYVVVTDHILDAQRFGRQDSIEDNVVPEDDALPPPPAYVMRHGATANNDKDLSRSTLPIPLDEKGRRQVEEAAEWLKDKGIAQVVSGTDARAMESAQIVSKILGVPVEPDERLEALNLGELAGKPSSLVGDDIKEAFRNKESLPGGESEQGLSDRVAQAVFEAMQSGGGTKLIVTHDSVIREMTKLFGSENESGESPLSNGWVASLRQNPDQTVSIRTEYPSLSALDQVNPRKGKPRGEEIAKVYGKLESKVPMLAQEQADMEYVLTFEEMDTATVKAMFPKHADKIEAGGSKEGQPQLDRIARLSVNLGIEATYIIGDSWQTSTTLANCWLRPGRLMAVKDEETRMSLLRKFPQGIRMMFAGDVMVMARPDRLDDHVSVVQSYPGCGQNRAGLMHKVLSIQKRLNNWVDLINHFFVRTVPQRYMDDKVFDLEALKEQSNLPGDYIPVNRDNLQPGTPMNELIWVEPPVQHQPALPDFINIFASQFGQLLSGALPTLFGSEANTDVNSATAAVVQRDQALQRLTTPWHRMYVGMCHTYEQAVRLAAQCRSNDISAPGLSSEAIRIEIADLKSGSILCYPEEDVNFPESWIQRQSRYDMMLQLSSSNPFLAKIISAPSNAKLARDMAAMKEFKVPEADAYDKQLGEAELLLRQEPQPNPEKQQALELAQQKLTVSQQSMDAEGIAQANALAQQADQMPDMVSSIPVSKDWDIHAVEAQAVADVLNSADGRRRRIAGTQKERLGVQNLELHGMEHRALIAPPAPEEKPATFTANVKDLPPDVASDLVKKKFGVSSNPNSFLTDKVVSEHLKHPNA